MDELTFQTVKKICSCLYKPVVLNQFYIPYPFIEQDYQIYPQYTQCMVLIY